MSQEKLEVFNVLNFLNHGYELKNILNEGDFKTFSSYDECINYLTENEYIESNNGFTFEDVSKKYTVSDLKKILKENNLKVSGKKEELVNRILPILNGNPKDLSLTDKSKDFLDENKWIDLYMFALVAFKFEDYETYVKNSDNDVINTALKFCDEIITYSLINNQFLIFIDALSAKAHVYAYVKDYESFLDYDLQRFIFGLNPISLDVNTYVRYNMVNEANIINLRNVLEKFDFGSLKKRFDKIWVKSHIKDITVPKKTSFKILKKAIDGADINEINLELKNKFFDKKFGIK